MSEILTDLSGNKYEVRPDVITYDDVRKVIPKLDGHEKLVNSILHLLKIDEVNRVHGYLSVSHGKDFVRRLLFEDFHVTLKVDNEELLDHLPQGAFITLSNHPFGALDGIILIHLIASRRPEFKVMVNMILNQLSAMRPNFIAVDAWHSDDPEKRKVSVEGIRQTLRQLRNGEPMGFFPAGAMCKMNWKCEMVDREWKPIVMQIIQKASVPIIPIYFHGSNSLTSNILGKIYWPLRSLMLPRELFRKRHSTIHVTVGDIISVEDQKRHGQTLEEYTSFLRSKTLGLRSK